MHLDCRGDQLATTRGEPYLTIASRQRDMVYGPRWGQSLPLWPYMPPAVMLSWSWGWKPPGCARVGECIKWGRPPPTGPTGAAIGAMGVIPGKGVRLRGGSALPSFCRARFRVGTSPRRIASACRPV